MTTEITHKSGYCTVRFPTDADMGKAFEVLINESGSGFSGVNANTIMISGTQCEMLQRLKKNNQLNYDKLD